MKPFVDTFMASQREEGKNDDEEENNVEGSDEGELTDDKESKGDDATSHAEATEDVFTLARLITEGVDLKKQSTFIR
ncbi:hypothetical protein GOBAR_DD31926 [Gossypium barbadense]|nr:hypothetical protein GOBAR_DD31926 [Gossypium barbadense]